jgi:dihydropteroate synthase
VQNKVFSNNKTLNAGGRLIDLSVPKVMGILNVTPDSFSDGGKFTTEEAILSQTERMVWEGVGLIDVGGYSTRPGASDVSEEEESRRVVMAVHIIAKNFPEVVISVDTFRSTVARKAVDSGARMINDISGGEFDPLMFETVAELGVPYVLMHMRGTPQTMSSLTNYENLIHDILAYFHAKVRRLQDLGVHDIIIDPGFGFAKTLKQNFELLSGLELFQLLDRPLMVGLSRKSMIWRTLEISPSDSTNGTSILNAIALGKGANILRVHDVKEALQCVRLVELLKPYPEISSDGKAIVG